MERSLLYPIVTPLRARAARRVQKYFRKPPIPSYYVSKTGNDTTGDGLSPATAWLTVAKAYTTTPSGSVIQISAGTYTEKFSTTYGHRMGGRKWVADGVVTLATSSTYPTNFLFLDAGAEFYDLRFTVPGPSMYGINTGTADPCIFHHCTFTINQTTDTNRTFLFSASCSNFELSLCTLTITNLVGRLVETLTVSEVVNYNMLGCTLTLANVLTSAAGNAAIVRISGGGEVHVKDNSFTFTACAGSGSSSAVIYSNSATICEVSGNTFTSPVSNSFAFIMFPAGTITSGRSVTITGNTINTRAVAGYCIMVGDDGLPTNINSIAATIERNKIYGAWYFNEGLTTNTQHGIICGYISNPVVKTNEIRGTGYGVILKGTDQNDNFSGEISGNLIENNWVGYYSKGTDGARILNNNFVVTQTRCAYAVRVSNNTGFYDPTGLVIKYNQYNITNPSVPFLYSESPLGGLSSDYNVGQSANTIYASWSGVGSMTLSAWQIATGLDAHSTLAAI